MDYYKIVRQLYDFVVEKVEKKYLFAVILVVAVYAFMNITSIIWWAVLIGLIFMFFKVKKQEVNISEVKLKELCKKSPELDMCKKYRESKESHNKLVDDLLDKIKLDN